MNNDKTYYTIIGIVAERTQKILNYSKTRTTTI
jgi:hypothetical protein